MPAPNQSDATQSATSLDVSFRAQLEQAEQARRKGAINDAIALAADALASAQAAARPDLVALAQLDLGNLHRYVPNALESFRLLHAAEKHFRETADPLIAKALARQGMTLGDMGDHTRALDLYREALGGIEAGDAVTDNALAATCYGAIGVACTQLDDFEQAEQAYRKAIPLYDATGNQESICFVYNNLAILRIRTVEKMNGAEIGHADRARVADDAFAFIEEGLSRNQQHVRSIMLTGALQNSRGNLLAALGRLEESLVAIGDALSAYREMNLPRGIVDALSNLGETHCKLGNLDQSLQYLQEAEVLVHQHQLKDHERKLQQLLAETLEQRGDAAQALKHFKRFHQLETESQRHDTQRKLQQLALRAEIEQALAEAKRQRERSAELAASNQTLDRIAHEDALTGVSNRRRLDTWAGNQPAALPTGFAVALLDIDHFKKINDTHSHAIGDAVLREIGALLKSQARNEDLVARYGGEEFVVVLRGVSGPQMAERMERLRAAVERHDWGRVVTGLAVTTSIGVAAADGALAFRELVERADTALYAAKSAGRNRVVTAA
ncbi:MAG: diguanylate cyclase [Betaproteobacteria bacterium]|nr:diguanylate cyclase [Betaproteobacteria bacterium]